MTVNELTPWSFTEDDNGKVLRATITVELPWDGDPVMDGNQVRQLVQLHGRRWHQLSTLAAVLEDLTVTVTQTP